MNINSLFWHKASSNIKGYSKIKSIRPIDHSYDLIGITRIRNESAIIEDTLNHVEDIVDGIIVLDDFSTDNTVNKVKQHKKVLEILLHDEWKTDRIAEETEHRHILYNEAKNYKPKWIFYFDADERFDFCKDDILRQPDTIDGIKIRLFDAYMTEHDADPYQSKLPLWNFRKYFGPEYRDILMLFRNKDYIKFEGLDAREPVGCKNIITAFHCQHYGKSLSHEHWEETCSYYVTNFPEPYKSKWQQRKGKALHTVSDFGNPLFLWDDVKKNGIKI